MLMALAICSHLGNFKKMNEYDKRGIKVWQALISMRHGQVAFMMYVHWLA